MSDEAIEAALRLLKFCEQRYNPGTDEEIVARALLARDAEVRKLRERLEMDRVWQVIDGKMVEVPVPEGVDIPDAIECRDETIRLQDRRIAELEEQVRALKTAGEPSADGGKEGK